jgi:uncharacterized membrane protein YfcA
VTPIEWGLIYLALGVVVGLLAGLLGIGGGAVMVPMLALLMDAQGLPREEIVHLAVGTSMSTILFTSISSVYAHQRRRTIRWDLFRSFTPGILIGGLAGSSLAAYIPAAGLALAFTAVISVAATLLIIDRQPAPSRQLPGAGGRIAAGAVLGTMSSLAAMGGAFAAVPYMVWCNVPIRPAIGTAAALGFPIALAGTVGYVANGWDNPALPPWSLGFVYLPATAAIVLTSVLMAPVGARLAYTLPAALLRRIFAVLLYLLAARLLFKIL